MTVDQMSIEVDVIYRLIKEELKKNNTSPDVAVFIIESVANRIRDGVLSSTSFRILRLTGEINQLCKPVEIRKCGTVEDLMNSFNKGGFNKDEGVHGKKE